MTAFRYRALQLDGREIRGVVDADTARQARGLLKRQGLLALDVDVASKAEAPGAGLRTLRLPSATLLLITRQWATLLEAGLTVERALAALAEQHEEPRLRQLLGVLRAELQAGHPLHRALALFPRSFDPLYCALVAAGEQSGQLGPVMLRLADSLEHSDTLRQKLVQALVYPVLVVLVASAVVLAMMVHVVPQVVVVFQNSEQSLPWLTQALILLSDVLRASWPLLLGSGLLAAWGLRRAWRVPAWREAAQRRLLRLPALGRLLLALDSARLAQTLAILAGSGVPLLTALQAGTGVVWLLPLRTALERATNEVREGSPLHRALGQSRLFPPLLVHMVASGESSGQLDTMLEKAARQQAGEVGNRLALAMSLLEPLLILGMGGVVLLIVLAILQPILEINQLLR